MLLSRPKLSQYQSYSHSNGMKGDGDGSPPRTVPCPHGNSPCLDAGRRGRWSDDNHERSRRRSQSQYQVTLFESHGYSLSAVGRARRPIRGEQ